MHNIKGKVTVVTALAIMVSILCFPATGSCNIETGDLAFANKDAKLTVTNSGSSPGHHLQHLTQLACTKWRSNVDIYRYASYLQ